MSPAEFLSTENCQCLVLLFPRLHCVVHACIQMLFSEIVLLTSTIITVASSYQLMSPFNCFFPVGWSIYMLSYVSNGVCRLSGCKILSECYLCCSDLLGHSFDTKVLPFYPRLPECFTSETLGCGGVIVLAFCQRKTTKVILTSAECEYLHQTIDPLPCYY